MSTAAQAYPPPIRLRRLDTVPPALPPACGPEPGTGPEGGPDREPTRLRLVDDFGPLCSGLADLPDPQRWLMHVGVPLYEAATGARPVTQVMRWLSPGVYDSVVRRTGRAARRGGATRRPVRLRRVQVGVVSREGERPGVAEGCVIVDDHRRVRAMALRLEGLDGRWLVTACEIG